MIHPKLIRLVTPHEVIVNEHTKEKMESLNTSLRELVNMSFYLLAFCFIITAKPCAGPNERLSTSAKIAMFICWHTILCFGMARLLNGILMHELTPFDPSRPQDSYKNFKRACRNCKFLEMIGHCLFFAGMALGVAAGERNKWITGIMLSVLLGCIILLLLVVFEDLGFEKGERSRISYQATNEKGSGIKSLV